MAEPFSLVVAAQISAERLSRFLAEPVLPTGTYNDWDQLGLELTGEDFGFADKLLGKTAAHLLANERAIAMERYGWLFRHDSASGQLNIVSLDWSEHWGEMIAWICILRQLAAHCPDGGYALAHGFVFRPGQTAFLLSFSGGSARILADDLDQQYVAHAQPTVDYVINRAERADEMDPPPSPAEVCTDQFDQFLVT